MVLVDTSVWVSHFRRKNTHLEELLLRQLVYCHPLIMVELACRHLQHGDEILQLMGELPMTLQATDQDALVFIEKNQLAGKGVGIVDIHLLASASLSGLLLWTEDKRMCQTARLLQIDFNWR